MNIRQQEDSGFIQKVLFLKLLQFEGINLKMKDLDSPRIYHALKLLNTKLNFYEKKSRLEREITIKQLVKSLLEYKKFQLPKKQARLLKVLSSGKPIKRDTLITEAKITIFISTSYTDRGKNKIDSLKKLVAETNKSLIKFNKDKSIQIRPLRGKPFGGYQLYIDESKFSVRVKNPRTKPHP